jgi:hypothetical protein
MNEYDEINLVPTTDGAPVSYFYETGGNTFWERRIAARKAIAAMPELALMSGAAEFMSMQKFGEDKILVKDLARLPAAFELAVERRIWEGDMDAELQQYAGEVMMKTIAANVNPEDYAKVKFLSRSEYINSFPDD